MKSFLLLVLASIGLFAQGGQVVTIPTTGGGTPTGNLGCVQVNSGANTFSCGATITVGALPVSPSGNPVYLVGDGASAIDCTVGGGSHLVLCGYKSGAFASLGGAGGSGVSSVQISGTANQIVISGTCTIVSSGNCVLGLPSVLTLPGTVNKITFTPPTTAWTIQPLVDNQVTVIPGGTLISNTGSTSGSAGSISGTQTANYFYAGPNGSSGTALWRLIVAADIPSLPYDASGAAATAQSNAEAYSANASHLSSGTVPSAQIPSPTATTLGGVESFAAVSHKWLTTVSTSGIFSASQPASTDLSDYGSIPNAALENFSISVDGITCTLGSSCNPLVIGATIASSTAQDILFIGTGGVLAQDGNIQWLHTATSHGQTGIAIGGTEPDLSSLDGNSNSLSIIDQTGVGVTENRMSFGGATPNVGQAFYIASGTESAPSELTTDTYGSYRDTIGYCNGTWNYLANLNVEYILNNGGFTSLGNYGCFQSGKEVIFLGQDGSGSGYISYNVADLNGNTAVTQEWTTTTTGGTIGQAITSVFNDGNGTQMGTLTFKGTTGQNAEFDCIGGATGLCYVFIDSLSSSGGLVSNSTGRILENPTISLPLTFSSNTLGINVATGSTFGVVEVGSGLSVTGGVISSAVSGTVTSVGIVGATDSIDVTGASPITGSGSVTLTIGSSGNTNTVGGYQATLFGISTSHETSFGFGAIASSTNNLADDTAVGYNALNAVTASAGENTAVGSQALLGLTTGTQNVGIGYKAATTANGNDNVVIGYEAGDGIINHALTSGSNCTLVGAETDLNGSGSFTNCGAFGYQAIVPGSNEIGIGNSSVTDVLFGGGTAILHGVGTDITGITIHPFANVALTGQVAAIGTTSFGTTGASGLYRVCYNAKVTTPATASSALGAGTTSGLVVTYTDATDSTSQTITIASSDQTGAAIVPATGNVANTTAASANGCAIVYAKTGTAISYAFGYTSSGATPMAYEIHASTELSN